MVVEYLNALPDYAALIIISAVIGVLNTAVYKYLGDQKRMKKIRDEIKRLTEEYKKTKSEKTLSRIDSLHSQYMKTTFKPMIVSMVLVFMFFPLITGLYGDVRGKDSLMIMGDNFTVSYDGNSFILNGPEEITTPGVFEYKGKVFEIRKRGDEFRVSRVILLLPVDLPLVGRTVGWILFYVIVSLPLMTVIRRAMGVEI